MSRSLSDMKEQTLADIVFFLRDNEQEVLNTFQSTEREKGFSE